MVWTYGSAISLSVSLTILLGSAMVPISSSVGFYCDGKLDKQVGGVAVWKMFLAEAG